MCSGLNSAAARCTSTGEARDQIDQLDFGRGQRRSRRSGWPGQRLPALRRMLLAAHVGILDVRRGLPVEIQGGLPIKGDHLGVLARQHGVLDRANAHRLRHSQLLLAAQVGVLLFHHLPARGSVASRIRSSSSTTVPSREAMTTLPGRLTSS